MFGWIASIFKSSETRVMEDNLQDFDGYLSDNTLAMNAADKLVSNLEEAGYSKAKIKKIVKTNLPKIISLVKKNKRILELAQTSSDVVVERNDESKDLFKDIKKNVTGKGEKEESSALSKEDKATLAEIKELLGEAKQEVPA